MARGPLHVCYCCKSDTAPLRTRAFFRRGSHTCIYVCCRCDATATRVYERTHGKQYGPRLDGAWEDMAPVPYTGADPELDARLAAEGE